jgi:hypothetical protein
MVQLALQEDAYLEACSAYQEVWDTKEVKDDESREINVSQLMQDFVVQAEEDEGIGEYHDICRPCIIQQRTIRYAAEAISGSGSPKVSHVLVSLQTEKVQGS